MNEWVNIGFAAVLAAGVRIKLLTHWAQNPHSFFYQGVPLPIDTDAGYYVLAAQGRTLGHPQNLLSWLLAKLSPSRSTGDLLNTGNWMLVGTAFLSCLAIGWAFWLHGLGNVGAVVAAGTTSCGVYLARTTIGRLDTDQLNVTFLVVILSLIAKLALVSTEMEFAAYALPLAVITFLFDLWFPKPIFLVLFSGMVSGAAWYALGPYAIPTGVAFFAVVGWREFPELKRYAVAMFNAYGKKPGTAHNTVSELERISVWKMMELTLSEPALCVFSAFGLGFAAYYYPVLAVTMTVSLGFFFLAWRRGQRFLPYAAPALWFGVAVCLQHVTEHPLPNVLWMALVVMAHHVSTHKTVVHSPKIGAPVTHMLHSIAKFEPGTLLTWWDYGYWVRLWTPHEPVCDPQAPWSSEVVVVAEMLTTTSEKVAHDAAIRSAWRMRGAGPVYVLVTSDMYGWFHAIRQLAGRPEADLAKSVFYRLFNKIPVAGFKHRGAIEGVARLYEVVREAKDAD